MGRIRTIKPEWLTDEKMKAASDEARVLSVAVITLSDDYGNGEANELTIAGAVWSSREPLEALAKASRGLRELGDIGFLQVYRVSGQPYFHVANWSRHQRVDKPGKPLFPGPERADNAVANHSRELRETVDEALAPDHDHDLRPTTNDQDHPSGKPRVSSPSPKRKRSGPDPKIVAATARTVVDAFNNCFERNLGSRGSEAQIKALLARGYTEPQMRAVMWWAGEEWADDDDWRMKVSPTTMLKLTSSNGNRTFPQYLELASELWRTQKGETPPWEVDA